MAAALLSLLYIGTLLQQLSILPDYHRKQVSSFYENTFKMSKSSSSEVVAEGQGYCMFSSDGNLMAQLCPAWLM